MRQTYRVRSVVDHGVVLARPSSGGGGVLDEVVGQCDERCECFCLVGLILIGRGKMMQI